MKNVILTAVLCLVGVATLMFGDCKLMEQPRDEC